MIIEVGQSQRRETEAPGWVCQNMCDINLERRFKYTVGFDAFFKVSRRQTNDLNRNSLGLEQLGLLKNLRCWRGYKCVNNKGQVVGSEKDKNLAKIENHQQHTAEIQRTVECRRRERRRRLKG